ncbi:MAG: hypothetical protein ACFFEN_11015 [Candidatus Thorarchaeota archaeon]
MNIEENKHSDGIKAFKIVAMCDSEQEAQEEEEKLKSHGQIKVVITKPSGDGPYGNHWLVKIPIQWLPKPNKSFICSKCKRKYVSITDFFVCWNCDNLECVMCASKRLLNRNNKLFPKMVGSCQYCGANWGFFNMAPTVRYMLAQHQPISKVYLQMGILGPRLLDLWFLGVEVDDLTNECEELARGLPSQIQIDVNIWLEDLKTIRNNYQRMEKSLTYMIDTHYSCLNSEHSENFALQDIPGPIYKKKLIYAQVISPLLNRIIKMFNVEENESNFIENVSEIRRRITDSKSNFNITQNNALIELSAIKRIEEENSIHYISELIKNVILG